MLIGRQASDRFRDPQSLVDSDGKEMSYSSTEWYDEERKDLRGVRIRVDRVEDFQTGGPPHHHYFVTLSLDEIVRYSKSG